MKKNSLIIFFIPPEKIINGGIMSIFSQCSESRAHIDSSSSAIVCTYPGFDSYIKNDLFENDEKIYSFKEVVKKWPKVQNALFHIPEVAVNKVADSLRGSFSEYVQSIDSLHLNIMNQNIELMPDAVVATRLFQFTNKITQTTAHEKYATQKLSDAYQMPVHHLSVFIDKKQYKPVAFSKKENIIAYSPDSHPAKEKVLSSLRKKSKYSLVEITDMSYKKYKELIGKSKFVITFGEGMDGYFIESFFSGSIGLAVYNNEFFPSDKFKQLESVFDSYPSFESSIAEKIKSLDNQESYSACSKAGLKMLTEVYNIDRYRKKIERFYKGEYDFYPDSDQATTLIGKIQKSNDTIVHQMSEENETANRKARHLNRSLDAEKQKSSDLRNTINDIESSASWKVTAPLRSVSSSIRKKD